MGGAASILFWCTAVRRPQAWSVRRSGALVWAHPSAATPAGAGGWGRWGARCAGPAASPPPASRSLLWEGGRPLGSGGAEGRSCGPQAWGGERVGGWGGRFPAPPPSRASAPHPLSPACPPGVYSCRGGCLAAAGVGRGPVGRQWVSAAGGGGRGGEPARPGSRPRFPWAGLCRGRSVCAVMGAAGPPSAGSGQGVRALASAVVPPQPGCSGLFGGGAGPPSLRSASVRSWA